MKLRGKWRIAWFDGRHPRLYVDATEVQIFEPGPWIGFRSSDGASHLVSFPAVLNPSPARTADPSTAPEGQRGEDEQT